MKYYLLDESTDTYSSLSETKPFVKPVQSTTESKEFFSDLDVPMHKQSVGKHTTLIIIIGRMLPIYKSIPSTAVHKNYPGLDVPVKPDVSLSIKFKSSNIQTFMK